MIRYGQVEVRCETCPETTWISVGWWKGGLDRDELRRGLAADRWTAEDDDRHYCPRCSRQRQPLAEE